jgi:hypothetical protein
MQHHDRYIHTDRLNPRVQYLCVMYVLMMRLVPVVVVFVVAVCVGHAVMISFCRPMVFFNITLYKCAVHV